MHQQVKSEQNIRKWLNKETNDGHRVIGFSALRIKKIRYIRTGRSKEWKSNKQIGPYLSAYKMTTWSERKILSIPKFLISLLTFVFPLIFVS